MVMMPDSQRVLVGVQDLIDDLVHTHAILNLCKNKRSRSPNFPGITVHHGKISPHNLREVSLVDDQQIGLGDPRATLARDLVAPRKRRSPHLHGAVSALSAFNCKPNTKIVALQLKRPS